MAPRYKRRSYVATSVVQQVLDMVATSSHESPNGGFITTTSKRVRRRSISAIPCAASPAKSRRRTLPPCRGFSEVPERLHDAHLGLVEEAVVVDA